jgi:hypothetical protein
MDDPLSTISLSLTPAQALSLFDLLHDVRGLAWSPHVNAVRRALFYALVASFARDAGYESDDEGWPL